MLNWWLEATNVVSLRVIQKLHALILSPRKILRCFSANKHLLGTNLSHLWKKHLFQPTPRRDSQDLSFTFTIWFWSNPKKKYLGNHRRTDMNPGNCKMCSGFWVLKTPEWVQIATHFGANQTAWIERTNQKHARTKLSRHRWWIKALILPCQQCCKWMVPTSGLLHQVVKNA